MDRTKCVQKLMLIACGMMSLGMSIHVGSFYSSLASTRIWKVWTLTYTDITIPSIVISLRNAYLYHKAAPYFREINVGDRARMKWTYTHIKTTKLEAIHQYNYTVGHCIMVWLLNSDGWMTHSVRFPPKNNNKKNKTQPWLNHSIQFAVR